MIIGTCATGEKYAFKQKRAVIDGGPLFSFGGGGRISKTIEWLLLVVLRLCHSLSQSQTWKPRRG
jgi:hypothetical protein